MSEFNQESPVSGGRSLFASYFEEMRHQNKVAECIIRYTIADTQRILFVDGGRPWRAFSIEVCKDRAETISTPIDPLETSDPKIQPSAVLVAPVREVSPPKKPPKKVRKPSPGMWQVVHDVEPEEDPFSGSLFSGPSLFGKR